MTALVSCSMNPALYGQVATGAITKYLIPIWVKSLSKMALNQTKLKNPLSILESGLGRRQLGDRKRGRPDHRHMRQLAPKTFRSFSINSKKKDSFPNEKTSLIDCRHPGISCVLFRLHRGTRLTEKLRPTSVRKLQAFEASHWFGIDQP